MRGKYALRVSAFLLLAVAAEGKKKTEADFSYTFSVIGTSVGSMKADRWCVMTLTDSSSVYHVYSNTWQCQPFSVGSEVKGRHTTYPLMLQYAPAIELMWHNDKGKLKTHTYIVDSEESAH